jgi:hypothetical protein
MAESLKQSGQMMGLLGSDPMKRLKSLVFGNFPQLREPGLGQVTANPVFREVSLRASDQRVDFHSGSPIFRSIAENRGSLRRFL